MEEDQSAALILDVGSGYCKAGISGDDFPKSIFPSVIGRPKMPGIIVGMDQKETFVGEEAQEKRGVLTLRHPIKNGIIYSFLDFEKILHHCFYSELRLTPEEHPLLLSEEPENSKRNREKTTELIFESFNVPAFYLAMQSVLSLYGNGRVTGLVLSSGEGITNSVPVFEGYSLPNGIQKSVLSGKILTDYLAKLLIEYSLKSNYEDKKNFIQNCSEKETIEKIKENVCYVAEDYENELLMFSEDTSLENVFQLPDGLSLKIREEQFKCPEILFQPMKIEITEKKCLGLELPGIHEMIYQSIMKCDLEIRKEFCENIILSGGNTLIKGIEKRLLNELYAIFENYKKIQIAANPNRKISAWIGGSILSSLSTFQNMWITKAEYEEFGEIIVHRKCF